MAYTLPELVRVGMPVMMGMLVDAASKSKTITYGDVQHRIENEIGGRFSSIAAEHIGGVAGSLMHKIEEAYPDKPPPPINALVVNGTKKLPGDGVEDFLHKYLKGRKYKRMSDKSKRKLVAVIHERIWGYKDWTGVARRVFDLNFAEKAPVEEESEHDGKAKRQGLGGPAESDEHRRLKLYVKAHPQEFGAPERCEATVERSLRSHDEIDVFCVAPDQQLAIEVKSTRSNDLDIERGIFQCIKYKAVIEAQNLWDGKALKVRARLVSERKLSGDSAKQAKRLVA